jgi:hypothetical protein
MKKIYGQNSLWIIGIPALFSGFALFYGLYQSSARSAAQTCRLIQSELIYIMSEKDDMELIDFGTFLKDSDPPLILRAWSNDKIILSVGNGGEISTPLPGPQGLRFEFPNRWVFHSIEPVPIPSGAPLDLFLSFPPLPNPWPWAILDLFSCLITGMGLTRLFSRQENLDLKQKETTVYHSATSLLSVDEPSVSLTPNAPLSRLSVDKDYLVKSVSKAAAALLQRNPIDIVGHHILDLSPDPGLLEIFKRGQNAKVKNAFLPPIYLTAEVISNDEGWIIALEKAENGQKD